MLLCVGVKIGVSRNGQYRFIRQIATSPGIKSFLGSWQFLCSYSPFMKFEVSSSCPQEPATGPIWSRMNLVHILTYHFLKIHVNTVVSSMPTYLKL